MTAGLPHRPSEVFVTIYDGHSADPWAGESLSSSASVEDDDAVAQGAARLTGHLIVALGVVVVLTGLATICWLTAFG